MDNEAIARRFFRLAALMEIRGDDPFRLRSYRNAGEAIETWPTPLKQIAKDEGIAGLQSIPGVGKAIAGKIIELLERGTFDAWERLTAETPETVLDLLELPGVGPFRYVRFHNGAHGVGLSDEELAFWAKRIRTDAAQGYDIYIYFNNDPGGHAIMDARRLRELLEASGVPLA